MGLGKFVLGVAHLLRIEGCPERVLLVLEAGVLELEFSFSLFQFSMNFLDPYLGELGEVSTTHCCSKLAVIVATVTWRWSVSTLAPSMIQVQPFPSH